MKNIKHIVSGIALSTALLLSGCDVTDPIYDSVYEVKITNDGKGTAKATIGGTDITEAGVGATTTVTANPNTGYRFRQWSIVKGDVTLSPDMTTNPTTFTMPLENVEIRADFELIPAFSVSPDTDQTVAADAESFEFTVTANTPWECWVDGMKQDEGTGDKTVTVTFQSNTDPVDPVEVEVKFMTVGLDPEIIHEVTITQTAVPTYAITMTNDSNGTAAATVGGSPAATAIAGEGETVTITAMPNTNYQFKRWVVVSGGTDAMLSSTTTSPATFTMPANAIEIRAEFQPTVAYVNSLVTGATIAYDAASSDIDKTVYTFSLPAAPAGTEIASTTVKSGTATIASTVGSNVMTITSTAMEFAAGPDITVEYTVTYQDVTSTVTGTLTVPFTGPAKNAVGGVYYKEGLAQGVVFVANTGVAGSGRMVHLYGSVNRIAWSNVNEATGTTNTDGLTNMNAVKALSSDFSNYPAFAWVDALNGPAGTTIYTSGASGIWYLPALHELGDFDGGLYKAYDGYGADLFNNALTTAGGNSMLDGYSYCWTSVEHYSNTGRGVYFSSSYWSFFPKAEPMLVRPICLF